MAEWLGKGLQNPVQQFNSACDLKLKICTLNSSSWDKGRSGGVTSYWLVL